MAAPFGSKLRDAPVSQSAVSSLKAIFSILMGLSVTNTLVVLIHDGKSGVSTLAGIDDLHGWFAGVLLFTIARFYLGNIRHVDDVYVVGAVDGRLVDPRVNSASRFVRDFTVLLLEALLFSLASFYVIHRTNFIEILMLLLVVDILWTVSTRGVAPHSGFWFDNNLVHLVFIAICFGFHIKYTASPIPFYFAIGLLLTNGLLDFAWNRDFYFADRRSEKGVFLSAPFTQLLTDGSLPAQFRERLIVVIDHLVAKGWAVDNAHRREQWGASLDSPYAAVNADLEGIEEAAAVVAFLGVPPSPGVQLEIGYAIARNKKLVLIADHDDRMPYLIRGLVEQEGVVLIRRLFGPTDHREVAEEISTALTKLGA